MTLLDADVCIDYLNPRSPVHSARISEIVAGISEGCCSVIVMAEILSGCQKPRQRLEADAFLGRLTIIPIDVEDAERAGVLRMQHRQTGLGLGDAFIAATAIRYGLPLLTRNVRHFQAIPELVLEEP